MRQERRLKLKTVRQPQRIDPSIGMIQCCPGTPASEGAPLVMNVVKWFETDRRCIPNYQVGCRQSAWRDKSIELQLTTYGANPAPRIWNAVQLVPRAEPNQSRIGALRKYLARLLGARRASDR